MSVRPIWIEGRWQEEASPLGTLQSFNPATGEALEPHFPISGTATLETALRAGAAASRALSHVEPERIATFLDTCAQLIEADAAELVESAHRETGLPREPRLRNVELPRTTGQLRQAARAVRERSFCDIHIDTKAEIRSYRAPIGGPVAVFGPNNFPFAFNAVMGGDFAAAIAAGNPVIAKAHPSHLGTSERLARLAERAIQSSGLPPASVQLVYALPPELGLNLVSHSLVGASAFTGSRNAGLALKAAADRAGKPIYLEMSAVNPMLILPGALVERGSAIAKELGQSCTLGTGQFCTKPGLSVVCSGPATEAFERELAEQLSGAPLGHLFAESGVRSVADAVSVLLAHGAELVTGGKPRSGPGFGFEATLLRVSGQKFLAQSAALQTEAFGPVHLIVSCDGTDELLAVAVALHGSLTGSIYSDTRGSDDALAERAAPRLRAKVGRLLNDKMPTGVAVSAAMNHGGPFPATGHPGFTSVGLPASIARFTALHCYDQVRQARLPAELSDENPAGLWRNIDGEWTRSGLSPKASPAP